MLLRENCKTEILVFDNYRIGFQNNYEKYLNILLY